MTTLTRQVWDVVLQNERFYNKMEYAYAKRLIKWTTSANAVFDHIAYLEYIQSLKLVKQKQEVNFLVKIFGCAGLKLNEFELRHFQNERKEGPLARASVKKKAALASDGDIQVLISHSKGILFFNFWVHRGVQKGTQENRKLQDQKVFEAFRAKTLKLIVRKSTTYQSFSTKGPKNFLILQFTIFRWSTFARS